MYRTEITLTVLSEEPIDGRLDIADIVRECDQGDFVLHSTRRWQEDMSIEQMAYALLEAGSDPGFFQLDSVDTDALISDWQYEVRNADTMLGFHDWLAHRFEASKV